MKRFPEGKHKSALIETLFIAQKESGGWLSSAVMDHVAEIMGLLPVEVYEVATCYTMFNLEPVGRHVFHVCQTGPCVVVGSENIIDYRQEKLNIKDSEATECGLY